MKSLYVRSILTFFCGSFFLLFGAGALAEDYKMTSLDWPPYTNEKLPAKGATSAVVSEVMRTMGSKVNIEFYAWSRTLNLVKSDNNYIAYFPEYYSKANEADFLYSDPIGSGPLAFIERKTNPILWASYESLKGKKIGIVRDYVNTAELDSKIASKALTGEEAPDDVKNILKLAAGRVDVAVVDVNVYNFLTKSDPLIKEVAGKLQVNGKILEDKKLYVCFKKSPEGEKARLAFNEGLKKIDVNAIMKKYMN